MYYLPEHIHDCNRASLLYKSLILGRRVDENWTQTVLKTYRLSGEIDKREKKVVSASRGMKETINTEIETRKRKLNAAIKALPDLEKRRREYHSFFHNYRLVINYELNSQPLFPPEIAKAYQKWARHLLIVLNRAEKAYYSRNQKKYTAAFKSFYVTYSEEERFPKYNLKINF